MAAGKKSSQGSGKGGAKGGAGPKRHKKVFSDTLRGITKPALRRLARRAGATRVSAQIYPEARLMVKVRERGWVVAFSCLFAETVGSFF